MLPSGGIMCLIIYLYYISADAGESQPDEVTNGDITQDIGTTLGCEVKQQDIASEEWGRKRDSKVAASATSTIPSGKLQLPTVGLQQQNSAQSPIPDSQAIDHSSKGEHGKNNICEVALKTRLHQKATALSTSDGQFETTTSMKNQSSAQFCHNDFHKGEILSERLSIKIDSANYMSTSKSDGNSVAELLPAPNYIFSPNITRSEPHQQQSILMHNHRLQQQKVLAEGPRSGSSDDARAVHYNDARSSSSVILSDHGGVKTMIWKDNFPIRGAENPSVTLSNIRPTTMTMSEHSHHLMPPLATNPHNHRPIAPPPTPTPSAHFQNQLQQQQTKLPCLLSPQPQYRPLPSSVGFTRMGAHRGQQHQPPQQLPSHLFRHKSADKDIIITAKPSSGSALVYPPPPLPSTTSNSLPCQHNHKSEERIDQLITADQAIRMSNAVDGLLSLRTVRAAAAAAAAATSVSSSSPSSSSFTTKLWPSRPSSTPNIMTPLPHMNQHMPSSPGKRRSPINMERLWAGDRSQLQNHGHQSTGDVRI